MVTLIYCSDAVGRPAHCCCVQLARCSLASRGYKQLNSSIHIQFWWPKSHCYLETLSVVDHLSSVVLKANSSCVLCDLRAILEVTEQSNWAK